jgi:hypothetical protein
MAPMTSRNPGVAKTRNIPQTSLLNKWSTNKIKNNKGSTTKLREVGKLKQKQLCPETDEGLRASMIKQSTKKPTKQSDELSSCQTSSSKPI